MWHTFKRIIQTILHCSGTEEEKLVFEHYFGITSLFVDIDGRLIFLVRQSNVIYDLYTTLYTFMYRQMNINAYILLSDTSRYRCNLELMEWLTHPLLSHS